jgi:hypothetical protein
MPITPYLDDFAVDPETKRVLNVVLEMTRVSLGLKDDLANGIIAKRIIELAKAGESIPISCVKARSSNYAGICTATNSGITSQAYPVAVVAFESSRPFTIGTRSTNWANLLGGVSRKMASYRPTLSRNTLRG